MILPLNCVVKAYQTASSEVKRRTFKNLKEKSSFFIESMHKEFAQEFSKESGMVVFSKEIENEEFKRSEYLVDLLVGIKKSLPPELSTESIPFIDKILIAIESEFRQNIRHSIIDFNKLTMLKADIKIMILPLSRRNNEKKNYLLSLTSLILDTTESYYAIFIPYPSRWDKASKNEYRCYSFHDNSWEMISI